MVNTLGVSGFLVVVLMILTDGNNYFESLRFIYIWWNSVWENEFMCLLVWKSLVPADILTSVKLGTGTDGIPSLVLKNRV